MEAVTLDNGTVVEPSQVLGKPEKSQCFAFIFLPNDSYLDDVLANFDNTAFADFFD